jgi:hypothetical protein
MIEMRRKCPPDNVAGVLNNKQIMLTNNSCGIRLDPSKVDLRMDLNDHQIMLQVY